MFDPEFKHEIIASGETTAENSNDEYTGDDTDHANLPEQKWSPHKWHDTTRKSAFRPYKLIKGTVLTNLQRGNTQADTITPHERDFTFYEKSGRGEIIAADITDVNGRDPNGLTALHWACFYGQLATAALLLDQNADVNAKGPDGETPLLLASAGGHNDVVKKLLSMNADPDLGDDFSNRPLMFAAMGNHPHTCNELLLNGASLTARNMDKQSAFDLAVLRNCSLAKTVLENHMLKLLMN